MSKWHVKIWKLDEPDEASFLYQPGARNEFWLEPGIYAGPTVRVGGRTYQEGALIYKIAFQPNQMSTVWGQTGFLFHAPGKGFKLGKKSGRPPKYHPKHPQLRADRLENNTLLGSNRAEFRIYETKNSARILWVSLDTKDSTGGSGGGWANAR